jgi:O-antigen/teichoic acid export membrane protein
MFRYGARTYLASFLMFALIRSNLFLINTLMGEHASGVFSIALQFTDLLFLLPATLGMILFPKVSEDPRDAGLLTAKVFRFSFMVITLVTLSLFLLWTPLIELLYGAEFGGAVAPLMALTPGIIALSLVMILNNDLAGRGLPPIVIIAPLVGLISNVALHFVLVPPCGLVGSALSSSVSYVLVLVLLYRSFRRTVGIPHSMLFRPRLSDFDPNILRK